MQIDLDDELAFFKDYPEILEEVYRVIEHCLKEEKVPCDPTISLTVVQEEEIQAINHEYRNINKVTDVLSFPQIEPSQNGHIIWEKEATGEVLLGDIILCYEKAITQAQEYGHTLKREVCFLIAHSMLHLLGYDHIDTEQEKIMFDKQEYILKALNITR